MLGRSHRRAPRLVDQRKMFHGTTVVAFSASLRAALYREMGKGVEVDEQATSVGRPAAGRQTCKVPIMRTSSAYGTRSCSYPSPSPQKGSAYGARGRDEQARKQVLGVRDSPICPIGFVRGPRTAQKGRKHRSVPYRSSEEHRRSPREGCRPTNRFLVLARGPQPRLQDHRRAAFTDAVNSQPVSAHVHQGALAITGRGAICAHSPPCLQLPTYWSPPGWRRS
jgi:hypothetical protein